MAQVDYFLTIDGIEGESTNPNFKAAIDIESFSWGVTNSGSVLGRAAGGGGGAGKVSAQDIHFTSEISKAGPKLFLLCATGKHIGGAVLTGIEAGRSGLDFLTIKLTEVLVSSYQTGGSTDGRPQDQFTLNFAKMEIDYRPQTDQGTLAEAVPAIFDFRTNIKF